MQEMKLSTGNILDHPSFQGKPDDSIEKKMQIKHIILKLTLNASIHNPHKRTTYLVDVFLRSPAHLKYKLKSL